MSLQIMNAKDVQQHMHPEWVIMQKYSPVSFLQLPTTTSTTTLGNGRNTSHLIEKFLHSISAAEAVTVDLLLEPPDNHFSAPLALHL